MSPENAYILDDKDYPCQLTYAATIDNQILKAHIDHCIKASEVLGIDYDLHQNWKDISSKIPPVLVGNDSTIMEWIRRLPRMGSRSQAYVTLAGFVILLHKLHQKLLNCLKLQKTP